jgi:tetrachlorobenzoquinone reductase
MLSPEINQKLTPVGPGTPMGEVLRRHGHPVAGLALRVRAITWEAEGVLGFELVPEHPGSLLPPVQAGAHIVLSLQPGLQRSYSLLNTPGERHRYQIAVNLDAHSRGGSRHLHQQVRPGDLLSVAAPANNFALDETAPLSVLIAGGIGVTPLLSMARRLVALGRPWQLLYAARSRHHAAFVAELQALAEASGAAARFHFDDEHGGRPLDLAAAVAALPQEAQLYCCGPLPMLGAFEAATAGWPRPQLHLEYFAAKDAPAMSGGYRVELRRSGRTLAVPAGQSLLDCLRSAGIDPPSACEQGICGTCEVRVLAGLPDHRDLVLSETEKAANDRMMICCSGAKSDTLVIDL